MMCQIENCHHCKWPLTISQILKRILTWNFLFLIPITDIWQLQLSTNRYYRRHDEVKDENFKYHFLRMKVFFICIKKRISW